MCRLCNVESRCERGSLHQFTGRGKLMAEFDFRVVVVILHTTIFCVGSGRTSARQKALTHLRRLHSGIATQFKMMGTQFMGLKGMH